MKMKTIKTIREDSTAAALGAALKEITTRLEEAMGIETEEVPETFGESVKRSYHEIVMAGCAPFQIGIYVIVYPFLASLFTLVWGVYRAIARAWNDARTAGESLDE